MRETKLFNPATIFAVAFAFFGWGGWAYFVSRDHGQAEALRTGLTQGLYSGVMTFYMSFSVQFLYRRTKHYKLAWLLPTLGTVGHTGILLVLAHTLNHSPNIARIVTAPLIVAALYCLYLTKKIRKAG